MAQALSSDKLILPISNFDHPSFETVDDPFLEAHTRGAYQAILEEWSGNLNMPSRSSLTLSFLLSLQGMESTFPSSPYIYICFRTCIPFDRIQYLLVAYTTPQEKVQQQEVKQFWTTLYLRTRLDLNLEYSFPSLIHVPYVIFYLNFQPFSNLPWP